MSIATQLEELTIISDEPRLKPSIFQQLSLPRLHTLRFAELRTRLYVADDPKHLTLLLALQTFPSLQKISVGPRPEHPVPIPNLQVALISWRKTAQNQANSDLPPEFFIDTLDCMIRTLSYRPSGDERKIFSKTKHLRLCCDRGCTRIDNILHVLESATSISTLTLCAHKSSTPHPILVALSHVPASIEEIRLVFSSLGDSQLKWDSWDLTISRALSANPRPHPKLRSLKVVIMLKSYEANHKTDRYPELVNLLSDSRDWCLVHRLLPLSLGEAWTQKIDFLLPVINRMMCM